MTGLQASCHMEEGAHAGDDDKYNMTMMIMNHGDIDDIEDAL